MGGFGTKCRFGFSKALIAEGDIFGNWTRTVPPRFFGYTFFREYQKGVIYWVERLFASRLHAANEPEASFRKNLEAHANLGSGHSQYRRHG